MKFVVTMMVIELIIVDVRATTHKNDNYIEKVSLGCIVTCTTTCSKIAEAFPVCMALCLLTCSKDPKSNSEAVKKCSTSCAQSVCSKYGSGNSLFRYIYNTNACV